MGGHSVQPVLDEKGVHQRHDLDGAVTNVDELRQGFSIPSLLAIAFMLGGAWAAFPQLLGVTIPYGGSLNLIYSIWVVGAGCQCTYMTMGEMASAWPTSSGPQEYAFQLASPRFKRAMSYATGWSMSIMYLFALLACTVLEAGQILAMVSYAHPSYEPKKVHIWAVNCCLLVACALINIFGIKAMHRLQTFSLLFFIAGFFIWLIVPVAVSPQHATPKQVFTTVFNKSGWSDFVAMMIGLSFVQPGYGIPDTVTHLAEETSRPEIDIPRAMYLSPAISTVTYTAMAISMMFCGVDFQTLLDSPTGYPYYDFLSHTVVNRIGVICLSTIILYAAFTACLEAMLGGSRAIFTFAREGGAFLPQYLGTVHPKLQVPVWSIALTCVFNCLFSLLLLGSDMALHTILGCIQVLQAWVYVPLLGLLMWRMRKFPEVPPMSLGRWGWPINIGSMAYQLFTAVFWHFPYTWPYDAMDFNYNIVIVPGLLFLGYVAWFFSGRHKYIIHRKIE